MEELYNADNEKDRRWTHKLVPTHNRFQVSGCVASLTLLSEVPAAGRHQWLPGSCTLRFQVVSGTQQRPNSDTSLTDYGADCRGAAARSDEEEDEKENEDNREVVVEEEEEW